MCNLRSKEESSKHSKKDIAFKGASIVFSVILTISICIPNVAWANADSQNEASAQSESATTVQAAEQLSEESKSTTTDTKNTEDSAIDDQSSNQTEDENTIQERADEPGVQITPQSTGEEDGKYSIVVEYVDEDGNAEIAPKYQKIASKGETCTATSPTIGGYELADSTQTTVQVTVEGDNHYQTYLVKYRKTSTTYTVIHMKQADENVYYPADTETKTALANTIVTEVPKNYANYHCITTDLTVKVSPDGKSTIYIYYDQTQPTYTIYFHTNGSYVPYISGVEGASVTAPADPTRVGYTFAGWDQTIPTTMPAHNVYINAKWTPSTVNYVVNYWKEDPNNNGSYLLGDTETKQGLAGTTTPTAEVKDTSATADPLAFKWYTYDHEDPVTIAADGSSVLNVYYNLDEITLVEQVLLDDNTTAVYSTRTVKYGLVEDVPDQTLMQPFYASHGGTKTSFSGWRSTVGSFMVSNVNLYDSTVDYATKTATYQAEYTNDTMYLYAIMKYNQSINGDYDTRTGNTNRYFAYTGINFIKSNPTGFELDWTRTSTNQYDLTNYDSLTWTDWNDVSATPVRGSVGHMTPTTNVIEVRYKRLSYDTNYYSQGADVKTVSHLYQQTYDTSAEVPSSGLTPPSSDYTFGGWYDNPEFEGNPVSTSLTTPAATTNLYAKWNATPCKVTFDSNGGTPVSDQTVDRESTVTQPTDPTKPSGAQFVGWYFFDANGVPALYEFDKPVESDIHLVAMWNPPTDNTSYTVIHQALDGTVLATETFTGSATETVTASELGSNDSRRAGYQYSDATYKSINLDLDPANNVITFYYSNDQFQNPVYKVRYLSRSTGEELATDYIFSSDQLLVDVYAKDIAGYTVEDPTGWVSIDDSVFTFYYDQASGGESGTLPKTGDTVFMMIGIISLIVLAGVGFITISRRRRRNER